MHFQPTTYQPRCHGWGIGKSSLDGEEVAQLSALVVGEGWDGVRVRHKSWNPDSKKIGISFQIKQLVVLAKEIHVQLSRERGFPC